MISNAHQNKGTILPGEDLYTTPYVAAMCGTSSHQEPQPRPQLEVLECDRSLYCSVYWTSYEELTISRVPPRQHPSVFFFFLKHRPGSGSLAAIWTGGASRGGKRELAIGLQVP